MTEKTFKVGDKVKALNAEVGAVTYGPFESTFGRDTLYVVQLEHGRRASFKVSDLTPVHAFAVGDKATRDGHTVELLAGPVTGAGTGEDVFLYKYLDGPNAGKGGGQPASVFEPLPATTLVPVGTRVRVDRALFAEESHGKVGQVVSNTETWHEDDNDVHRYRVRMGDGDRIYVAELTPVDEQADPYTYQGITYRRYVTYIDSDGDTWEFGGLGRDGFPTASSSSTGCNRMRDAIDRFGPMTEA